MANCHLKKLGQREEMHFPLITEGTWGNGDLGINPLTGTDWASDSDLRPATSRQIRYLSGRVEEFTLALTYVRVAIVLYNSRKFALLAYQNWPVPGVTNLSFLFVCLFGWVFFFLTFYTSSIWSFSFVDNGFSQEPSFWMNVWNSGRHPSKCLCSPSRTQSHFWWLQTVRNS